MCRCVGGVKGLCVRVCVWVGVGGGGPGGRGDHTPAGLRLQQRATPVPLSLPDCPQVWSTEEQKMEAEEVMKVINERKPEDL